MLIPFFAKRGKEETPHPHPDPPLEGEGEFSERGKKVGI